MKKNNIKITNHKKLDFYIKLFFRFLKEEKMYHKIKNKERYNNKIFFNRMLTIMPERYTNNFNELNGERNLMVNWLVFLSKNTPNETRNKAYIKLKNIIETYNIDEEELNFQIKNYRNNLGFNIINNTILDDEHNKSIEDVAKNIPIGLLPFYMIQPYNVNPRNEKAKHIKTHMYTLISEWLDYISKILYYGNIR